MSDCDHSNAFYMGYAPWGGVKACQDCGKFCSYEYGNRGESTWIKPENAFVDEERWKIVDMDSSYDEDKEEYRKERLSLDLSVRIYKEGDEPKRAREYHKRMTGDN